jgi:hypothetical protein
MDLEDEPGLKPDGNLYVGITADGRLVVSVTPRGFRMDCTKRFRVPDEIVKKLGAGTYPGPWPPQHADELKEWPSGWTPASLAAHQFQTYKNQGRIKDYSIVSVKGDEVSVSVELHFQGDINIAVINLDNVTKDFDAAS